MNIKQAFLITLLLTVINACSKLELAPSFEEVNLSLKGTLEVSSTKHNAEEAKLFDLVNEYRLSLGLNKMIFNSTTYYYSGTHNDYMISKNSVSHDNFKERAQGIAKNTGASHVAENVARNYKTMEEVLEAWKASPLHKESMEGNYTYSAISIKENKNGNLYFTQMFFR